jgi:tetratricopeptide (TPR) repeat protein
MEQLLTNFVDKPRDPMNNFLLGRYYEERSQYAAAIGFYLRAAEFGEDDLLTYEALLRLAINFEFQGRRSHTMKGVLLRAVSVQPNRPEAYFLIARTYEVLKEWHEAYAWSIIGLKIACEGVCEGSLHTDVQYPGVYGFIYERAVVSWWIGLYYESLSLFKKLEKQYKMLPIHGESVKRNIETVIGILRRKGKYDDSQVSKEFIRFDVEESLLI